MQWDEGFEAAFFEAERPANEIRSVEFKVRVDGKAAYLGRRPKRMYTLMIFHTVENLTELLVIYPIRIVWGAVWCYYEWATWYCLYR